MKVYLDRPSLSLNRLLAMHWSQRKKYQTAIRWQVRANLARLRKEGVDPRARGPRRMHLTRIGARLLDEDNLSGGAKPIVDALVREGYLVDDSPEHAELVYSQVTSKDRRETIVELEEID